MLIWAWTFPRIGGPVHPRALRCAPSSLAILLVVSSLSARADEVLLKNGLRLAGTATALSDGRVRVETSFGVLTLPQSSIARVERGVSPHEAVRAALANLAANDADGRVELALGLAREGTTTLARELLREALSIDPNHPKARAALGYRLVENQWLTEEQIHQQRGEVWFRDAWVSVAERERILAWETARFEAEATRQRAAARTAEIEAAERARREEEWAAARRQQNWCCATSWGPAVLILPPRRHAPRELNPEPNPPRRPAVEMPRRTNRGGLVAHRPA